MKANPSVEAEAWKHWAGEPSGLPCGYKHGTISLFTQGMELLAFSATIKKNKEV